MSIPKYTLKHDRAKKDWALQRDKTHETIRRFDTKQDATKGGVLPGLLGNGGGSVKIKKMDGTFEEERTYPSSADPRKTRG